MNLLVDQHAALEAICEGVPGVIVALADDHLRTGNLDFKFGVAVGAETAGHATMVHAFPLGGGPRRTIWAGHLKALPRTYEGLDAMDFGQVPTVEMRAGLRVMVHPRSESARMGDRYGYVVRSTKRSAYVRMVPSQLEVRFSAGDLKVISAE